MLPLALSAHDLVANKTLASLNAQQRVEADRSQPLSKRIAALHRIMAAEGSLAQIGRIGVATYDPSSDLLKTFIASDFNDSPFGSFEAPLSMHPALSEIAKSRIPRIIDDITHDGDSRRSESVERLTRLGLKSSYTFPVFFSETLIGFCFLDADRVGYFDDSVQSRIWPFVQLLSVLLAQEYEVANTMRAALTSARAMVHYRDTETAAHLDRMARYARLIARGLKKYRGDVTDEFIELVYWSASLHDVGKIAVPDSILLKPGKLTPDEYSIMQTHVLQGLEIIDLLNHNFDFGQTPQIRIVRNVVAFHHECMDGSGYPFGLSGDSIPLEGRIVAVADVFDALTGERPYKVRWGNDEALGYLSAHAGSRFDVDCVTALLDNAHEIPAVQAPRSMIPTS